MSLRILSSPKPPSPALYFASKANTPAYISKSDLCADKHQPQGRKFYLNANALKVNGGDSGSRPFITGQPHLHPNQKSAVTPVRASAEFWFHVDFDNLTETELGALLYALRPTKEFRHKLGMGRPLGLGSVRIDPAGVYLIDRNVRYGKAGLRKTRYAKTWFAKDSQKWSWPESRYRAEAPGPCAHDLPSPGTDGLLPVGWYETMREGFRKRTAEKVRFAVEWLGRVHGDTDVRPPKGCADLEVETYKWFVKNDDPKTPGGQQFLKPLSRAHAGVKEVDHDETFTIEDLD